MDRFKLILMMVFGGLALIGVALFATYKANDKSGAAALSDVVMWGPFSKNIMLEAFGNDEYLNHVKYRQVPLNNMKDLLESIGQRSINNVVDITNYVM